MIEPYRNHLACPFEIYSGESKRAYEVLGMTKRTYDLGDATPEYQKRGMGSTVWTSIGVSASRVLSTRSATLPRGGSAFSRLTWIPGMDHVSCLAELLQDGETRQPWRFEADRWRVCVLVDRSADLVSSHGGEHLV